MSKVSNNGMIKVVDRIMLSRSCSIDDVEILEINGQLYARSTISTSSGASTHMIKL